MAARIEANRILDRFSEMIPDSVIYIMDRSGKTFAQGNILDANPAAAKFYGYSIDELKRMSTKLTTLWRSSKEL